MTDLAKHAVQTTHVEMFMISNLRHGPHVAEVAKELLKYEHLHLTTCMQATTL